MSQSLTERYDDRIAWVLSCYDRLVITGTLPTVCYAAGMTGYLNAKGIRIFDNPQFAMTLPKRWASDGDLRCITSSRILGGFAALSSRILVDSGRYHRCIEIAIPVESFSPHRSGFAASSFPVLVDSGRYHRCKEIAIPGASLLPHHGRLRRLLISRTGGQSPLSQMHRDHDPRCITSST